METRFQCGKPAGNLRHHGRPEATTKWTQSVKADATVGAATRGVGGGEV